MGFIDNMAMRSGRRMAMNYSLKRSEKDLFKECWRWRNQCADQADTTRGDKRREVERQFAVFAEQIKGNRVESELGHSYIKRAPVEGQKYVIFSDHHWCDSENRQNFFGNSGNRELYIETLQRYYDEGYVLVENGDVEELVIFDPTLAEIKRRAEMTPEELDEYRRGFRVEAMQKILDDPNNDALYDILRQFHEAGRYVKIAGNHDYDLQFDENYELLQTVFPGIDRPYDYLLLESQDKIEYAILHGHQFDEKTNPTYAKLYGETISESSAWAYEGPDRIWRWETHGRKWASEFEEFHNFLAGNFEKRRGQARRAVAVVLRTLRSETGFEDLFENDIGWEYFRNSDRPNRAYREEVRTGEQWFKFRHLDEFKIKDMMLEHFPQRESRPKLVLGHTHEVRYEPTFETEDGAGYEKFPYYFNTGAAGRFENLIWGLEIVDGFPKLISWSRENGIPTRKTYFTNSLTQGHKLITGE